MIKSIKKVAPPSEWVATLEYHKNVVAQARATLEFRLASMRSFVAYQAKKAKAAAKAK